MNQLLALISSSLHKLPTLTVGLGMLLVTQVNCVCADQLEALSYETVVGNVIRTYPNLESAALQIEQSLLELDRINSTLGWQARATTLASHDVGLAGTPTDVLQANGSLSRLLKSGDTVSVDASYVRSDDEFVFTPALPNPSNDSAVNLRYRKPLLKGAGNIAYKSSLQAAKSGIEISKAEESELKDVLAGQVASLYFALATTEVNLANTRDGIKRLRRLQKFVIQNKKLGVSGEEDVLQAQARLDRKLAELKILEAARNQQIYNLNRLMHIPASKRYRTTLDYSVPDLPHRQVLRDQIFDYSPALNKTRNNRKIAESSIAIQRDAQKDTVDLILSVGARSKIGESETDDINETDMAGLVGVEYAAPIDKSGLRASLRQAILSRDIADNQIRTIGDDLDYDLDRLLGDIRDLNISVASNRTYLNAEKKSFDDAINRYQSGRINTDELIRFEENLSIAEILLATQRVNLIQSVNEIQRLRGEIWADIDE